MRSIATILFALLATTAVARATPAAAQDGAIPIQHAGALPPPTRHDLVDSTHPYLIGPFDKLTISVFGVDDLKQDEIQADASGRLSVPLAGTIQAAGKTPNEVAADIATQLRRYIRDPQVTVNLKETISQVVTVEGQVTKPGQYPVIGRMTLLRAIAVAEGTSEFAKLSDVVVFRTIDNVRMAALFSLKDIRKGRYDDPEIYANDVVSVGESQAQHILKDLLQVGPTLFTTAAVIATR